MPDRPYESNYDLIAWLFSKYSVSLKEPFQLLPVYDNFSRSSTSKTVITPKIIVNSNNVYAIVKSGTIIFIYSNTTKDIVTEKINPLEH